jgi:hypothetical protein
MGLVQKNIHRSSQPGNRRHLTQNTSTLHCRWNRRSNTTLLIHLSGMQVS